MNKKMLLFLRTAALCFVGLAIMASELALVGAKSTHPTVRQPTNGVAVQPLSKRRHDISLHMQTAKRWAEVLDTQSSEILKASSMGTLQRWRQNIDLTTMKTQYAEGTLAHLKSMTSLFKVRRQMGRFKDLKEFDFQNMVRKSDYLMALPTTKESLDTEDPEIERVLVTYSQERQQLSIH
ncbi:hypothetical protein ACLWBD_11145 [Bdellovibrio sp. HCB117]|uniref:hypothetical protein n=1 Tax=Bdellovibrio sp. HCB117 TaxID=3394359 RepID=UPI0039B6B83B